MVIKRNVKFTVFECLEASRGWIEPVLQRIKDDRTVVVCPVIDFIDAETMRYS